MGEPFCGATRTLGRMPGRFTLLFDTGVGAWGRGQSVERSVCFADEWKLGNVPSVPAFQDAGGGCDSGSASRNSRNCSIAAACSGLQFTPSCSAFLTPERCSGANAPNMSASSFRDGAMTALGGKISYGCPRYCLAKRTSSPEESRKAFHGRRKDLWKSMNTSTFTFTVSHLLSFTKKT